MTASVHIDVVTPSTRIEMKSPPTQPLAADVNPESVVYPGMFFGKSQSAAAQLLLEKVGRPVKTRYMVPAFRKGGLPLASKNAVTNLWKTLARNDEKFVLVPKAGWGLIDWYDAKALARMKAARASEDENGEAEA